MGKLKGLDNLAFEYEMGNHSANKDKRNGIDELGDNRCGIGCFSPDWLQKYATRRTFMVVFGLLGVIQGMTWSYFSATITTLEKRFKISSQTSGIVMTGNEISQIVFSLLVAYFGGKGHRPRWIASGVLVSAVACFVLTSPHLFYGSGQEALSLTNEYDFLDDGSYSNASSSMGTKKQKDVSLCIRNGKRSFDSCDNEGMMWGPLVLIFLSQFISGIGVVLFFTLGGPYLDDNTKRKNIPIYFGITMSLRLIGPTIGYVIASGALKLYVNPLLTPKIGPDDPRWIGAWWLGWLFFGASMVVFSMLFALFPRSLKDSKKRKEDNGLQKTANSDGIPKLSDIPKAVHLLLKNKINLFNNLAGVFYLFAGVGYWSFMPKYLETIFLQSASSASIVSGIIGIFSNASGILVSGFLISRFQFSARKLAAWNVFTALLLVAAKISFTQIGCDIGKIAFGTPVGDGTWNLTDLEPCNQDCNCKTSKINPICHKEMKAVYYSACHAGCTTFDNQTFGNCSCISDPNPTVELGNCAEGCSNTFMTFLAIGAIIKLIDATGRIGNMLISYRCVSLEERSLAIGLNILLLSALAFLPSPILFGRIIDNVCLVWGGASCGKKGNCMLYDGQRLRYVFNLTAALFTFIGALFDILVWYLAKDLDLYKEPEPDKTKDQKQSNN